MPTRTLALLVALLFCNVGIAQKEQTQKLTTGPVDKMEKNGSR